MTVASLRAQHQKDLSVYRAAHREWRNQCIHYVMIPVECFSFVLFVAITTGQLVAWTIGVVLALLSFSVATDRGIGLLACVYHLASSFYSIVVVDEYGRKTAFLMALVCWTVAWFVQVGVGHYLFEKNSPNVANMSDVSYLAMCLSVLIAWSS